MARLDSQESEDEEEKSEVDQDEVEVGVEDFDALEEELLKLYEDMKQKCRYAWSAKSSWHLPGLTKYAPPNSQGGKTPSHPAWQDSPGDLPSAQGHRAVAKSAVRDRPEETDGRHSSGPETRQGGERPLPPTSQTTIGRWGWAIRGSRTWLVLAGRTKLPRLNSAVHLTLLEAERAP